MSFKSSISRLTWLIVLTLLSVGAFMTFGSPDSGCGGTPSEEIRGTQSQSLEAKGGIVKDPCAASGCGCEVMLNSCSPDTCCNYDPNNPNCGIEAGLDECECILGDGKPVTDYCIGGRKRKTGQVL